MLHMRARALLNALTRKKPYGRESRDESGENGTLPDGTSSDPAKLARVLGLADLTLLGIGATLGVGVYVLAGSVAKNQAGPAVLVSLVLAAVASLFSGLCYVEFASRISQSGSAYTYTYLSIGEFAAYVIGWNLVLEYIIGTASEAKAISNQFDSLLGNVYEKWMTSLLPIHCSFLADYPDFIAAGITLTMTALISYGVAESTRLNSIFTFLNMGTVFAIVFSGISHVNPGNWSIRRADIPPAYRPNAGTGGFAPFGVNGIIVGAAKCFFGFIGFDCIATTGEESKNPKRNIPLSILLSLLIVFIFFFSIALVLTLIIPYYEQDADAPFPHIFDALGMPLMKWVVTIGSLFALLTGMFGALFPLPRILYAMSEDGLLYPSFAYVSPITKTPVVSSLLSGLLTAVLSGVFKLDQLVDMLSIGTLLAYTIVALSVLILRYSDEENARGNNDGKTFQRDDSANYKRNATNSSDSVDKNSISIQYISSNIESLNKVDSFNQNGYHKCNSNTNINMKDIQINGDCHSSSDCIANKNPIKTNDDYLNTLLCIGNDNLTPNNPNETNILLVKPAVSRDERRIMHDNSSVTLVKVKSLQTEFTQEVSSLQTKFDQGHTSLNRAIPLENRIVNQVTETQVIDQVIDRQLIDQPCDLIDTSQESEIREIIDKVVNDAMLYSIERIGEKEKLKNKFKEMVDLNSDQKSLKLNYQRTDAITEVRGDIAIMSDQLNKQHSTEVPDYVNGSKTYGSRTKNFEQEICHSTSSFNKVNAGNLEHKSDDSHLAKIQKTTKYASGLNEHQTNSIGVDESKQRDCFSKEAENSKENGDESTSNKSINVDVTDRVYSLEPVLSNSTESHSRGESDNFGYGLPGDTSSQVHLCEDSLIESSNNFARIFFTLFNINSKQSHVTPASQYLSKICISLFIFLTIVVCLILNSVFSVNLDLESTYVGPIDSNAALALSGGLHKCHLRDRNAILALSSGMVENYDVNYKRNRIDANTTRQSSSVSNDEPRKATRQSETLANCVTDALVAIASKMAAWSTTSRPHSVANKSILHSVAAPSQILYSVTNSSGTVLSSLDTIGVNSYRHIAEENISDSNSNSYWESVKLTIYIVVGVAYFLVFLILSRQNQDRAQLNFSVPLVPLIPCLSIFMNVYLMINLDVSTWVRFLVWMVIGLTVYFTYGIQHSKLSKLKTT